MKMQISDHELQKAMTDALGAMVRDALRSSSYGIGGRLQTMVNSAVEENASFIEDIMFRAIKDAVMSDEFKANITRAAMGGLSDKFGGAFAAVMIAAGRRAAEDAQITSRISEAARAQAIQLGEGGDAA